MRFQKINIGIWPNTGWRLQWEIDGITASHEILIQRASSPEGPWEDIEIVDYNTVVYKDVIPSWRGFNTLLFYRFIIREISDPSNILLTTKGITTEKAGTKITAEIIRQHELTLKGSNTHPGYGVWDFALFKRTKFGTVCNFCTDPLTGERGLVANCQQCKGTGYLEGWSNPVKFRARWLVPVPKSTIIETHGPSEEITRQMWTAGFPIIEPGDIAVEKDTGRAWRVKNISASEPNRVVVSQSMTVTQIDKQKVEGNLFYPGEDI